jgi:hypothetical protein
MRLGLKLRLTLQVAKNLNGNLNRQDLRWVVKSSKWNFKAFENSNKETK